MILGLAFHVVTLPLLQVLIYIHDPLQIPSVTGTGQLHLQWEDVHATVGNNAVQDTLWDTHYTNVVNHGAANYPELASVSNDVHTYTINLPTNLLVTHQDLASPHTHPNVGPAHQRGIPEPMQVMSHVSANLSSLHMFLIVTIAAGESRE